MGAHRAVSRIQMQRVPVSKKDVFLRAHSICPVVVVVLDRMQRARKKTTAPANVWNKRRVAIGYHMAHQIAIAKIQTVNTAAQVNESNNVVIPEMVPMR